MDTIQDSGIADSIMDLETLSKAVVTVVAVATTVFVLPGLIIVISFKALQITLSSLLCWGSCNFETRKDFLARLQCWGRRPRELGILLKRGHASLLWHVI
jgi:hypothetical protein